MIFWIVGAAAPMTRNGFPNSEALICSGHIELLTNSTKILAKFDSFMYDSLDINHYNTTRSEYKQSRVVNITHHLRY